MLLKEGKRLNYSELPKRLIKHKNTKSFTNRFQVVKPDSVSHTVVAHIAMDGHYYIHPDINQNRSIYLRERKNSIFPQMISFLRVAEQHLNKLEMPFLL